MISKEPLYNAIFTYTDLSSFARLSNWCTQWSELWPIKLRKLLGRDWFNKITAGLSDLVGQMKYLPTNQVIKSGQTGFGVGQMDQGLSILLEDTDDCMIATRR